MHVRIGGFGAHQGVHMSDCLARAARAARTCCAFCGDGADATEPSTEPLGADAAADATEPATAIGAELATELATTSA